MLTRWSERGDTLIEVLFAVTVFALIVVTTLSIMNQGTATSQRSVEITTVRQQMDGQAEMLRFLHDSYIEAYTVGATYPATTNAGQYARALAQGAKQVNASAFGSVKCDVSSLQDAFILKADSATGRITVVTRSDQGDVFAYPDTYARVGVQNGTFKSQGIWIEAIKGDRADATATNGYTDFHIRACWDAPGLATPMNLGTIVRLYEPRK